MPDDGFVELTRVQPQSRGLRILGQRRDHERRGELRARGSRPPRLHDARDTQGAVAARSRAGGADLGRQSLHARYRAFGVAEDFVRKIPRAETGAARRRRAQSASRWRSRRATQDGAAAGRPADRGSTRDDPARELRAGSHRAGCGVLIPVADAAGAAQGRALHRPLVKSSTIPLASSRSGPQTSLATALDAVKQIQAQSARLRAAAVPDGVDGKVDGQVKITMPLVDGGERCRQDRGQGAHHGHPRQASGGRLELSGGSIDLDVSPSRRQRQRRAASSTACWRSCAAAHFRCAAGQCSRRCGSRPLSTTRTARSSGSTSITWSRAKCRSRSPSVPGRRESSSVHARADLTNAELVFKELAWRKAAGPRRIARVRRLDAPDRKTSSSRISSSSATTLPSKAG